MDQRLTYKYYQDIDSEKRNLLYAAGCLRRAAHTIYEYRFRKIERLGLLHLTDITSWFVCNEDDTINQMAFHDVTLNREVFEHAVHHGTWESELPVIEKLIDEGEFIGLQTNVYSLPFHVEYLPNTRFHYHHTLLLIGQDDDHFFFTDTPWELNQEFVPIETNETVGKIRKTDLQHMLYEDAALYFVITVNNQGHYDEPMWFTGNLKRSVDNYFAKAGNFYEIGNNQFSKSFLQGNHLNNVQPANGDNWSYHRGRNALVKLTQLICEKEVPLDRLFKPAPPDEHLVWWYSIYIGSIAGKRLMLSKALEEYSKRFGVTFDQSLPNALTESMKTWQILYAYCRKKTMTQDYAIDDSLKKRFGTVLEIEDRLIGEIATYLAQNYAEKAALLKA